MSIEAHGVVLAVENGIASIKVEPQAGGCGHCDEPGGCHSDRLSHLFRAPAGVYRLPAGTCSVGDAVVLRAGESAASRAAALAYGLPLLLLLVGAALGAVMFGGDGAALLGAGVGLGIGAAGAGWLGGRPAWRAALGIRLQALPDGPQCRDGWSRGRA